MIFFRKKKEKLPELPELPPLPERMPLEFPALPEKREFPVYEPHIEEIKRTVSQKPEELVIPQRQPLKLKKQPIIIEKTPMPHFPQQRGIGQPLFIKIEDYKAIIDKIESIRKKLDEAEHAFMELEKLREEESREFLDWRNSLESIKERLVSIDKHLFET